jgi:nucleoside-diphosphate-sugar epimerase
MRILVTGHKGFLGRFVMERLQGENEVCGLDLADVDLRDKKLTLTEVASFKPEAVVHLAANAGATGKGGAAESRKDPFAFLNNNVNATLNVLEAARLEGVSKLVFVSSFSVYGKNPVCPIDETTPLNPNNAYGLSKVVGEQMLELYSEFGIRSVVLRPTLLCGESQLEVNSLREFVIAALEGQPIEIWGEGLHKREYIHPTDAADAIGLALDYFPRIKQPVETFVLGNEPISMIDLAKLIVGKVPTGKIEFKPPGPQAFNQTTDHSKAGKILGWRPRIGVEELVDRVIEDVELSLRSGAKVEAWKLG